MVERLFLVVPWGCLRFVIVVFPDHTHLLFLSFCKNQMQIKKMLKLLKQFLNAFDSSVSVENVHNMKPVCKMDWVSSLLHFQHTMPI